MSVLIKGMQIPENCTKCGLMCALRHFNILNDNRPSNCPLAPLPDHQEIGQSNSTTKFKPGDKFLLEIGEKRIGLDEYEIVGTDLYVWGSLLEKLPRYENVRE